MKNTDTIHSPNRRWLFCAAIGFLLGTGASYAGNYANEVKKDNPAAYYRLEEQAQSSVFEDAMGSYPGNWFYDTDPSGNPIYPKLEQPGLDVNSAAFHPYTDTEGTFHKSYGEVPFAEALNPSSNFTVEFWARPTSTPVNGVNRVPVNNFGGWSGTYPGWIVYQTGGADSSWIWIMKGGNVWMGGGSVAALQWYHLVATYDGTTVNFYVNGALKSTSAVAGYEPNAANSLYIGLWDGSDTEKNWDGNVDDIALYNQVLSFERIQAHYQVGTNSIRVADTAPTIIQAPSAVTNFVGHVVKFAVTADGTNPLSYQWYKGTSPIVGATNTTLSFSCALADNGSLYKVVVTNPIGSAESTPVKLTVDTGLSVTAGPASIARYTGSTAAFLVLADGAKPMNYQWYKGTSPISGATGATLWLTNIQSSDDASTYYARVGNAFTSTNTEPATLTVTERPIVLAADGYAKIVKADAPVGYWRLNEAEGGTVVVDAAGSFDGEYDNAAGDGVFAYRAPAGIPNETDPGLGVSKKARVVIPYALELNPLGHFTAEAWLKPASVAVDGEDYRTAFSSEGQGVGGPTGWLVYQQPNNTWSWIIFGDYWINAFLTVSDVPVVANTWCHMVLVYDGQFKIYLNGELKLDQVVDAWVQNQNGSVNLGWRNDDDWKPWDGTLDEVAFYNKALTPSQIQSHYLNSTNAAPVTLGIVRTGNNVVLTWPTGTLQASDKVTGVDYTEIPGATSPYTITPSGTAKFYRIKVR